MPFVSLIRKNLDIVFILCVWVLWAIAMTVRHQWGLFEDNWFMSVTMAFGSFVAGATSQGGGAIAFPVMTLGFDIAPKDARDFSLMIQSVGMSSAAIAIFWRRIRIEKTALIYAGLGGVIGIIIGLEYVQQWFAPNPTKIFFVSLWLAFGLALWRINRLKNALRREELPNNSNQTKLTLLITGLIGGVVSGLLGSGLDILTFAILVLGFRICETVATPTSVILMAINSLAGFAWRGTTIAPETWNYWWVCVPIVAFGAPFGAWFIARRGRAFLVALLLFVIVAQFCTALLVVPFDLPLTLISCATLGLGCLIFWLVWLSGKRWSKPAL